MLKSDESNWMVLWYSSYHFSIFLYNKFFIQNWKVCKGKFTMQIWHSTGLEYIMSEA
jgi:hypothetical protein